MASTAAETASRVDNGMFPALRRLGEGVFERQVPLIAQAMASDCGAACLAMVLAYHGRNVGVDAVRTAMGVGRDGVNARRIVEVANHYLLRARGVRVELAALPHLPRGTILHWNFSHFVVLERVRRDGVRIVDPACGRRTVSMDEAACAFTGVAILLEPQDEFVRHKGGPSAIRRHLTAAFRASSDWPRIIFLSVFLQGLLLLLPLVQGRLVDRVVPRNDGHLLFVLVSALATIAVFHFLASMTRAQLLLQLQTLFDQKMTFGFVHHMLRLPYAFFERRHVGDLQVRIAAVAQIRDVLTGAVLSGCIDGAMVVGHLVLLFTISLRMALYAIGIAAVEVCVYLLTRRRLSELATNGLAKQAEAANAMNELLNAMESLKAAGAEHQAANAWANRQVEVMNVQLRQGAVSVSAGSLLGSLQVIGPMILLVAGILDVMDRRLSVGAMMSANALASGFLSPVMSLVSAMQSLQTTRAQLARIDDVRDTTPEQDVQRVRMAPRLSGAITLDRVSFRYGPTLPLAVRDVSLSIRPGESIAIVGQSGSGKTTLARLLLGLYEPTEGAVLFDGIALTQLDLPSVRRQLGVVMQRPYIFGTSIRANIALGDVDADMDAIADAARAACIHDDIARMPMGYDTPVVAGGSSLSGGQRQRLAVARALLRRPAVLLLDEATSALDTVTEAALEQNLRRLRCTRVVIAHRLSTVMAADRILVVEGGAVVEQGTHHELLARGGAYARLVMAQLADEHPWSGRDPRRRASYGARTEPLVDPTRTQPIPVVVGMRGTT